MPTYEYQCLSNGHRFEVKQSFADDPITVCQVCDEPVRKVYSAAGIVFKGSGYYVTDSRKSGKSAGATAGEKTSDGAKGKGEASGDKDSSGSDRKKADSKKADSTSTSGSTSSTSGSTSKSSGSSE